LIGRLGIGKGRGDLFAGRLRTLRDPLGGGLLNFARIRRMLARRPTFGYG